MFPLLLLASFLCGSVPFGALIARAKGVDIRKHGSGNIGATNVWRVLGRGPGLLCFVLDVLKGLVPTLAAGAALGVLHPGATPGHIGTRTAWEWLAIMAAAILGHMFSPWVGFRGGKGVATGLGSLLGVWPYLTAPAAGALVLWIALALITRYVSVASCAAALGLPVLVWLWSWSGNDPAAVQPFIAASAVLGALVVLRHRANLRRLWAGTENRIGRRHPPPAA